MVLSSKAYKLPGKNPQVQKSAILDVYFPAVGPFEGMNSG